MFRVAETSGIVWSSTANQFVAKIGYHFNRNYDRLRTTHYFGRDERAAVLAAEKMRNDWLVQKSIWTEIAHELEAYVEHLATCGPEDERMVIDLSKPVWSNFGRLRNLQLNAELYSAWKSGVTALQCSRESPERLRRDPAVEAAMEVFGGTYDVFLKSYIAKREEKATAISNEVAKFPWTVERLLGQQGQVAVPMSDPRARAATATPLTIMQLKDRFLAKQRDRVGRKAGKGIKASTFKAKAKNLTIALGLTTATMQRPRVSGRTPIDVETRIGDLKKSHCENFVNFWCDLADINDRSAANYCRAFKEMLDFAEGEEDLNFQLPKGANEIFSFQQSAAKIKPYTPDMIRRLLSSGTERCRMYILMGLMGMYQIDISALNDQCVVEHDGDHFILWQRQKESHHNAFWILTYMWPELYDLVEKHRATSNDLHRLLLDQHHRLIVVNDLNAGRRNEISDEYAKVQRATGIDYEFMQFRKCGMNEIKRISRSDDTVRMFAGQTVGGVLTRYLTDERQHLREKVEHYAPVTSALKQWHTKWKEAGVISSSRVV